MLQSVLADRFQAAIHTEIRDIPVNTIEVAKGVVKLRPASGQCAAAEGNASLPADQHRCHEVAVHVAVSQDRTVTWEYSGWSVSIADLAAKLSNSDLIVDETGLTGLNDFDVKIVARRRDCGRGGSRGITDAQLATLGAVRPGADAALSRVARPRATARAPDR